MLLTNGMPIRLPVLYAKGHNVCHTVYLKNYFLLSIQAYLVGCSFDSFSSDGLSRSYIWVLMVLAWLIPMIFIGVAYISILITVRSDFVGGKRSSAAAKSVADQQRQKVIIIFRQTLYSSLLDKCLLFYNKSA